VFVAEEVDDQAADLKALADAILEGIQQRGVVLVTRGPQYVLKVAPGLVDRFDATKLRELLGPGGGRPQLVQGKLARPRDEAVDELRSRIG
jgi:hypothetical protein